LLTFISSRPGQLWLSQLLVVAERLLGDRSARLEMDPEHLRWMKEAMAMVRMILQIITEYQLTDSYQAEEALAAQEVPVGCVFVRDGQIIAKARNRTNQLRNVGH